MAPAAPTPSSRSRECSKRDIIKLLGLPPQRIHVIGNAVDASCYPVRDAWLLANVRERYGIGSRFVLYFGGFDLRKNVPRLIEAYGRLPAALRKRVSAGHRRAATSTSAIRSTRTRARRCSGSGWRARSSSPARSASRTRRPLFSAATVFAFPSLYEGFGIPVLEAMACGTPVVTSNLSALPEVAGDAGLLVDPYDTDAISDGIRTLLEEQPRREELARRGLERAGLFTWQQVADQTLKVYRLVANGSARASA